MVPEDVYELTGVADPRLHPDGSTVAFVVWLLLASVSMTLEQRRRTPEVGAP